MKVKELIKMLTEASLDDDVYVVNGSELIDLTIYYNVATTAIYILGRERKCDSNAKEIFLDKTKRQFL